jgi:hypothetical protein
MVVPSAGIPLVNLDVGARHDTKVMASTLHGPEEVAVRLGTDGDCCSVGEDNVKTDKVV